MTNGSGDYAVAFSIAPSVRRFREGGHPAATNELRNEEMSPLFLAVMEATEEAIYNALFCASTVSGHRGVLHALSCERAVEILRRHDLLNVVPPWRPCEL